MGAAFSSATHERFWIDIASSLRTYRGVVIAFDAKFSEKLDAGGKKLGTEATYRVLYSRPGNQLSFLIDKYFFDKVNDTIQVQGRFLWTVDATRLTAEAERYGAEEGSGQGTRVQAMRELGEVLQRNLDNPTQMSSAQNAFKEVGIPIATPEIRSKVLTALRAATAAGMRRARETTEEERAEMRKAAEDAQTALYLESMRRRKIEDEQYRNEMNRGYEEYRQHLERLGLSNVL